MHAKRQVLDGISEPTNPTFIFITTKTRLLPYQELYPKGFRIIEKIKGKIITINSNFNNTA